MKYGILISVFFSLLIIPHAEAATLIGPNGQVLKVSRTIAKSGSLITVSGAKFDESVGIYLAFCVMPKKAELPSPCGGGVNKAGLDEASFWISSNPPPYAIGLTTEFLPGGRFTQKVRVARKIANFDCRKVICAITVRADHLRSTDRTFDLFIPIKIK